MKIVINTVMPMNLRSELAIRAGRNRAMITTVKTIGNHASGYNPLNMGKG